MKNTLKKKIIGVALATVMVVPTVASAAYGSLTGGGVRLSAYVHYAYADYSYNMVYARLVKGSGDTGYRYGWQSVTTPTIENTSSYGTAYYGCDTESYQTSNY